MIRYNIFLNKKKKNCRVGSSISYDFEPRTHQFKVFWRGKLIYRHRADVNDAYVVNISHYGGIQVSPMFFPKRRDNLSMWLLSVPKKDRTFILEEYEKKKAEKRKERFWEKYMELTLEGANYKITYSNTYFGCYEFKPMVAWVSENISKQEIIELLKKSATIRDIYYPKAIVRKLLSEIFEINDFKQLEDVL